VLGEQPAPAAAGLHARLAPPAFASRQTRSRVARLEPLLGDPPHRRDLAHHHLALPSRDAEVRPGGRFRVTPDCAITITSAPISTLSATPTCPAITVRSPTRHAARERRLPADHHVLAEHGSCARSARGCRSCAVADHACRAACRGRRTSSRRCQRRRRSARRRRAAGACARPSTRQRCSRSLRARSSRWARCRTARRSSCRCESPCPGPIFVPAPIFTACSITAHAPTDHRLVQLRPLVHHGRRVHARSRRPEPVRPHRPAESRSAPAPRRPRSGRGALTARGSSTPRVTSSAPAPLARSRLRVVRRAHEAQVARPRRVERLDVRQATRRPRRRARRRACPQARPW
jgi:hypothetical protein